MFEVTTVPQNPKATSEAAHLISQLRDGKWRSTPDSPESTGVGAGLTPAAW